MSRIRRTVAATVTLAVACTTLTACLDESSPHDAVRDFLVGWQSEDYDLAAERTDGDPAIVREALADAKLELDAASFRFKIKSISLNGDESRADFGAEVDLGENNPLWEYSGALPLHLVNGAWKVRWSPSVLHPQLKDGQRFAVRTDPTPRMPVVDVRGTPLQRDTNVYVAQVQPSKLGGQAEKVVAELSKITGFAQDRLLSKIRSSPPDEFVSLATFGGRRYPAIQDDLEAIPEITVKALPQPVAPDAPKDIVGKVSSLTPEDEVKLGGPQRAGDSIGQSGLQRAYQDYLTGSTKTQVITLDLKTGKQAALLKEWPGRQNSQVKTTIDSKIQRAADEAVADAEAGVLVAVKPETGEILAVGANGYNQEKDALAGKFPAGTAFSIVAADALIRSKVNPKLKLACPAERTVGGAKFVQTSQVTSSSASLQDNFAKGCVTALASLARRVDAAELAKSATTFGVELPWRLPLKSYSGSLPELPTDADKAKAIVGENVQMSPLGMALVAGAVASGAWHPPILVTDPKEPGSAAEVVPGAPLKPAPLAPEVRTALKAMMSAGATSAHAQAGSGKVYGVSSSAGGEDASMRWFVGWQKGVAIAVLAKKYNPAVVASSFFEALGNPS
ncbi:penicillin-binding transpeptidase domain-containing protein [Nonomuraea sp. NPDC005983]|uniref:penicillin-binding transpeptidase domain-containing protein n=1 Tax=Nonomuraea sp. NPDC005983 TaxID=3155595 RepID=UPI0033BD1441